MFKKVLCSETKIEELNLSHFWVRGLWEDSKKQATSQLFDVWGLEDSAPRPSHLLPLAVPELTSYPHTLWFPSLATVDYPAYHFCPWESSSSWRNQVSISSSTPMSIKPPFPGSLWVSQETRSSTVTLASQMLSGIFVSFPGHQTHRLSLVTTQTPKEEFIMPDKLIFLFAFKQMFILHFIWTSYSVVSRIHGVLGMKL